MKFINWVIFALLDPYPIQIWIHNTAYNTQLENTRAGALSVSNLEFDGEALGITHLTKSLNKTKHKIRSKDDIVAIDDVSAEQPLL